MTMSNDTPDFDMVAKQALSDMMDGEANEFQFRRALKLSEQGEHQETLQSYEALRALLRKEPTHSPSTDIALRVSEEIKSSRRWFDGVGLRASSAAACIAMIGTLAAAFMPVSLTEQSASAEIGQTAPAAVGNDWRGQINDAVIAREEQAIAPVRAAVSKRVIGRTPVNVRTVGTNARSTRMPNYALPEIDKVLTNEEGEAKPAKVKSASQPTRN